MKNQTEIATSPNAAAAKQAAFTPTEWVIGYEPSIPNAPIEIRADGLASALAHVMPRDVSEGGVEARLANARLIASAPKLLAALKRLAEKVKRANDIQHSGGVIEPEDWSELYDLDNEARAAIAKAEGAAS